MTGVEPLINGRGLVSFDYDKDGDLDLLFVDNGSSAKVYRNELVSGGERPADAGSVRVRLVTSEHPCLAPGGFGATVRGVIDGRAVSIPVHNNASYLSQSEMIAHVGTGDAEVIEELFVDWNDGTTTRLMDVAVNQEIEVRAYHRADRTKDGRLNFFDISALIRAYMSGSMEGDFDGDGALSFDDIVAFIDAMNAPCP